MSDRPSNEAVAISRYVDTSQVRAVLLVDGSWYAVDPNTFSVGPYEIRRPDDTEQGELLLEAGFGFSFVKSGGDRITGPWSAVLGLRH